jgi:hypothetical protein
LVFAFLFLSWKMPVIAFITAGICGAAISVLLKIPEVVLYKEVYALIAKFVSRIATGIVVSVVGLGFLSSKIINLAFDIGTSKMTIADVLCCPGNLSCQELGQSILIGIGILFGFSERLLSSFEETLVGKLNLPEREMKKAPPKGGSQSEEKQRPQA